jgi:probable HAF family extracellular repeat protein
MNRVTWTLLALGLPLALSATEYRFRVVDFPGASGTNIFAVNNLGQFVGEEQDAAGAQHAIFDDGRQLQLLDSDGIVGSSAQSWAFSINNGGMIAGAYQSADGALHGFLRHPDGHIEPIAFPGGTSTQAFGVNDLGTVIGVFVDAAGNNHAFVRRAGQYALGDVAGGIQTVPLSINDREEIVGEVVTTPGTIGFGYLQQRDGHTVLTTAAGSPPQSTFFISINNRNQILGAYQASPNVFQNFLRTGNVYQPFNLPAQLGATETSAQTINDPGEIVGWFADSNQLQHGFVAIPAAGQR